MTDEDRRELEEKKVNLETIADMVEDMKAFEIKPSRRTWNSLKI